MAAPTPTFVDDRLAHWAAHQPDGPAFTYRERSWTWREWEDRVRRCAGGLQAHGIGRGDVVAFLDKNHPACVELSMAAASLGAANAIVNWRSAGDEVDYAVNDSGARLLVFLVPLLLTGDLQASLLRAMTFMIVASPCAVVLATMPPLLSAIANAGRHGVLVKSAVVMERLGSVTTVALDKTGTLTRGEPAVLAVRPLSAGPCDAEE